MIDRTQAVALVQPALTKLSSVLMQGGIQYARGSDAIKVEEALQTLGNTINEGLLVHFPKAEEKEIDTTEKSK